MIRTLLADDEQHALERLRDLLSPYTQFKIIAEAREGTGALEQIVDLKPDVAFLDINMPGISVFKTIASLQNPPLIVFQTAHSKYAADAFDMDAVDYLTKPVSRERFDRAITKVLGRLSAHKSAPPEEIEDEKEVLEKISVKIGEAIKIIPVSEIHKMVFEEGLCFIYSPEGRFMADRSLNYYEDRLSHLGFFRSNRASLVNLEFVTTIHKGFKGNYTMELKDGSKIELSRRRVSTLKKRLDF
jgi:two-component system, LytTR family, response regulator